jgi:Ca2+-binding EF-hand superfamily protein/predicted Ser/Thr protein kinase
MCLTILSSIKQRAYKTSYDLNKTIRRYLRRIFHVITRQELTKRYSHYQGGIQLDTFLRVTRFIAPLGQKLFEVADKDHDGLIDSHEFIEFLFDLYTSELPSLSVLLFRLIDSENSSLVTPEKLMFVMSYLPRSCLRCGKFMADTDNLNSKITDFFGGAQDLNQWQFYARVVEKPSLLEHLIQSLLSCLPSVFDSCFVTDRLHCAKQKCFSPALIEATLDERRMYLRTVGSSLVFFRKPHDKVPFKVIISRGLFLEQSARLSFSLKFRQLTYRIGLMSEAEYDTVTRKLIEVNCFRRFSDDYRVLHQIGEGGFGKVMLARHKLTGRFVAVKVLKKDMSPTQELRLQTEITVLSLVHHPNLVQLLDIYEDFGNLYLVMEYLPYGSVHEWFSEHWSEITQLQKLSLLRQVASALAYLHSRGILHRDVKLANISICDLENTHFKLIDFGLSCFVGPGRLASRCLGSMQYMPPEMFEGRSYREEADSWSFGVLAYVTFTCKFPFSGCDLRSQILHKTPLWKLEGLEQDTIDMLKQLLEKAAQQRLTITELVEVGMLDELEPRNEVKVSNDLVNSFRS